MNTDASNQRTFSRPELAFLIAVPAAWGILLLFHPIGGDSFSQKRWDRIWSSRMPRARSS